MFDQFGAVKFEEVWAGFPEEVILGEEYFTSPASSSRKACLNLSVRMEMMWSAGEGGLVVFLEGGVVPNS